MNEEKFNIVQEDETVIEAVEAVAETETVTETETVAETPAESVEEKQE